MAQQIGIKEKALAILRGRNLSQSHKMMLADGAPPQCLRFADEGPKPATKSKPANGGVTLAPPLAVQKAIAADLGRDESKAPAPPTAQPEEKAMAKPATKTRTAAKAKAKPAKTTARRPVRSTAARKPAAGRYDWTKAAEDAKAGKMPAVPDFSASTHDGYRKRFDAVVALAKAGDLAGLKKDDTKPVSGSRKIICRYRDAAIEALSVKAK